MRRRQFINQLSFAAAAAAVNIHPAKANASTIARPGVQLWSLPKLLEANFNATIEKLATMGYREVEMYGPYPFSTDVAKKQFDSIVPSIGFSGSGFFGRNANEVKKILSANGMTVPSIHIDLDTLHHNMEGVAKAASVLEFKYLCLPAAPPEKRKTIDDYKRLAEEFNMIGASAKKYGLKFGYHNHGYGLKPLNGEVPLHVLLAHTDPSLVFLEMDIYWTVAGGADPVSLLRTYPDRYHLMHVKDMKQRTTFSGDGGDPAQWIELFPYMTTAGNGVLDIRTIAQQAIRSGVRHFFVEQDAAADPAVELKASVDYLKGI